MDLSKAYDVLNHELLLEKLLFYVVKGATNLWFKSYITNRRQSIEIKQSEPRHVCVNRYRYCLTEIKQGVPQGSIKGPLLFLLYINNLLLNIHGGSLVMFADDINILITENDSVILQSKLNRVIIELETWFRKNSLI